MGFSVEIAEEDRQLFVEAAELARQYYWEELGVYVRGPVRISVGQGSGPIPFSHEDKQITIDLGNSLMRQLEPDALRLVVLTEYFFLIQSAYAGYTSLPSWFAIGSASYAAYRAAIDNEYLSYEEVKERKVGLAVENPGDGFGQIKVMPDDAPIRNVNMAWMAIDFLLEGGRIGPLGEFLNNLYVVGRASDWESAFEATFGESVDSFSDRFEIYRDTLPSQQ